MKNNKGISLLTLLVTVVVLIIITSITAYNGINMVNDTRKKDAEDKLKVICRALLRDDTILNFEESSEIELTESDFEEMDLSNYYNEDYIVYAQRGEEINSNGKKIIYTLIMREKDKPSENYCTYTFDYNLFSEKYNYNIDFDESNGVNRPIVIEGMTALMPDGVTPVEDIYKDNWYSYKKNNMNFAKVSYEDRIYVWIPRFAYDIQAFYEERNAVEVPNSAINIIFLRENTNYMINDEVIQGDYKVHPAFSGVDTEYSGIWIEENARGTISTLNSPLYDNSHDNYNVHLMTNEECGAAIYLMFSLNNTNIVNFENDEYVAAVLGEPGVFNRSVGFVTQYTLNEYGKIDFYQVYGDAFNETPWNRVIEDYPETGKKYVIRKFSSSLWDFTNSDGRDTASYRGVITIK